MKNIKIIFALNTKAYFAIIIIIDFKKLSEKRGKIIWIIKNKFCIIVNILSELTLFNELFILLTILYEMTMPCKKQPHFCRNSKLLILCLGKSKTFNFCLFIFLLIILFKVNVYWKEWLHFLHAPKEFVHC